MLLFPKERYLEDEYASHTKRIDRWNCKATFRKQKTVSFYQKILVNTDYQILLRMIK
jgi:hypothetical protein